MTNKSSKYWIINSINDRNVEIAKTRIIWKFEINGKYTDYRLEDGNLNLSKNGDELYSNSYEVLSKNKIKLNGYEYKLVKLTKDSLMVTNDYYDYILVNYNR
ncbi:hypothetical protein [Psychroserpens ponticola]|uniref:Lipocalin-like domain-containing protein n=1 Tax=Psychroserpens ponticola TaxID=2932268 RepID=A0ABY7S2L9_9FLAO|nr:hypothetical protein [Psychroserpens ponticola]WCO03638.1 hypothetical protein MUN68_009025 [Psychroserpens ponticola]